MYANNAMHRFTGRMTNSTVTVAGQALMMRLTVQSNEKEINPLNIYILLVLSVATSIDALAVGLSFAFLKVSIVTPVIIIGTITFFLSYLGVYIGDRIGHFFENKIEIAGGILLIGIGIKILVEHLAQ